MSDPSLDMAELLGLKEVQMSQYKGLIYREKFPAGKALYGSNTDFDGIYIVSSGLAKTTLSLDNIEVVTGIATKSDVLGSDALHSPTFVSTATAVTDLTVLKVPAPVLTDLLKRDEQFREVLYQKLGAAIAEGFELIRLLATARANARLAFFLLKVSAKVAAEKPDMQVFDVGLSREEIGRYLGLKVATVSRQISSLAEIGYVRVSGKRMRIMDSVALGRIRAGRTLH